MNSNHSPLNPEPDSWSNHSPGDLSIELKKITRTELAPPLAAAEKAARLWSRTPLPERLACLTKAQQGLQAAKTSLAHGISVETGKPLKEALGEVDAVIAKITLTCEDAQRYLKIETPCDTPHPSQIRRLARGPAAVIAPFNFPLHLGHGAAVAYLAAGNPVLFKPSPLAAVVAEQYGHIMQPCFPEGVFNLVQGGGTTGRNLCLDPHIRSICFTGSIQVGRSLAQELATDFSKDLALELGGKNASLVFADADLDLAAIAIAQAACLTAGQRCNATSRIIVHHDVQEAFTEKLLTALSFYQPGDPLLLETTLGPLISEAAQNRYAGLITDTSGTWLKQGKVEPLIAGKKGYYVQPALVLNPTSASLSQEECFAPILNLFITRDLNHMLELHNQTPYGLTTSLFTRSAQIFQNMADELMVGNIYANLPTTFSPSTLPFGGLRDSGNGRPGGRGFIRFTTVEQALQLGKDTLT